MCYLFIITFLRIDWGTVILIFYNYFAIDLPSSYLNILLDHVLPCLYKAFLCFYDAIPPPKDNISVQKYKEKTEKPKLSG